MKIKRKYITKFQARITCYEVKEMLCEEQRVNVQMSAPVGPSGQVSLRRKIWMSSQLSEDLLRFSRMTSLGEKAKF